MQKNKLVSLLGQPPGKRNEKWVEEMTQFFANIGTDEKLKKIDEICWNYYNNIFDKQRFDYFLKVGNNYLPALAKHIPLQRPLVDLLVSQQLYRPFVFSPYIADRNSLNDKKLIMIKSFIKDIMMIHIQKKVEGQAVVERLNEQLRQVEQQAQIQPQNQQEMQQIMQIRNILPGIRAQVSMMQESMDQDLRMNEKTLDEVKYYYKYNFKDYKEEVASKVLLKLRQELAIKEKSKKNMKNRIVTGKEFVYVDIIEGEKWPRYESINPLKVTFPRIDGIDFIEDGPWVKLTEYYSFQQVMTEFGSELKKKYGKEALAEIEEASQSGGGTGNQPNYATTPTGDTIEYSDYPYAGTYQDGSGVKVERIFFKVPREVNIKFSPNPYEPGKYFIHFIDKNKSPLNIDEYKYSRGYYISEADENVSYNKVDIEKFSEKKGEMIKTKYINDLYEGVIINHKYFVKLGKKKTIRHPNSRSKVLLPIFGPTFSDVNNRPYSIIWATKDLQDLYDFVHTQKELMLALSGTKSIVYDRGQKPGDLSDDEIYYQMKRGLILVETIDKYGNPKRSQFNQWTAVDLSASNSIQYLDNMLLTIEETMGNLVGIPRPAKGQVVNSDQVGTFNASINRAQLITEVLYWDHDIIESRALTHLLNLSLRYSFRDGDDFELVGDDLGREIVTIIPKLFDEIYFEVRVNNNSMEQQKMKELRELILAGFKSGQVPFLSLLKAWDSDTLTSMTKKVEYFTEKAQELASQTAKKNTQLEAQVKSQAEQAKIQLQQEYEKYWKTMEVQLEKANLDLNKEKTQFDMVMRQREQELEERKVEIDAVLRAKELDNEQVSEMSVLANNDKHATTSETLQAISMQLEYLLKAKKQDDDLEMGKEKNQVEKTKAKKIVKEHVSDK